jgi:hypothetical protein
MNFSGITDVGREKREKRKKIGESDKNTRRQPLGSGHF